MRPNLYDEKAIQEAIRFLFSKIDSSNNPKPFAVHSIRSATILWTNESSQDAVIACVLHDLVEDTDTTIEQIEERFGGNVASIVDACTFDYGSKDFTSKLAEAKKSIDRAIDHGKDAVLVKAADFIDNSNYYKLADDIELADYLYEKFMYFMNNAKPILERDTIWSMLHEAFDNNVESLKS